MMPRRDSGPVRLPRDLLVNRLLTRLDMRYVGLQRESFTMGLDEGFRIAIQLIMTLDPEEPRNLKHLQARLVQLGLEMEE